MELLFDILGVVLACAGVWRLVVRDWIWGIVCLVVGIILIFFV